MIYLIVSFSGCSSERVRILDRFTKLFKDARNFGNFEDEENFSEQTAMIEETFKAFMRHTQKITELSDKQKDLLLRPTTTRVEEMYLAVRYKRSCILNDRGSPPKVLVVNILDSDSEDEPLFVDEFPKAKNSVFMRSDPARLGVSGSRS